MTPSPREIRPQIPMLQLARGSHVAIASSILSLTLCPPLADLGQSVPSSELYL